MRRAAGLAICAMLVAACAPPIVRPTPGGPTFENEEVRFVAPTGWQLQPSTSVSFGDGQIRLYLANQPLRADCDRQLVCRSPLANGLRPGGVLVTWVARGCVARSCDLPAAALTPIGNRQGVRVPPTTGCEATGFTERSTYYITVSPQQVDALFVCARDPSETTRSAFLGFLDAIHWRIP